MASERVYLPETDVHWKFVKSYVEREPLAGYHQASEAARERFRDLKLGVRIHWGLYSLWHLKNESWQFLDMEPKRKSEYLDLAKRFDPKRFDADAWMRLFAETGIRVFAFTTKHHEGFSLFDTKTRVKSRIDWAAAGGPRLEDCDTAFSVMESPMRRDVVGELCDAARRHGIAIDLYFSHPDWYDADFRPYNHHPARTESAIAHPGGMGRLDRARRLPGPRPVARRDRSHGRAPPAAAARAAHELRPSRPAVPRPVARPEGVAPAARDDPGAAGSCSPT